MRSDGDGELRQVAHRIMTLLTGAMWSIGQWPYTESVCPPPTSSCSPVGGDLDWVCLVSGPEEMALARALEDEARADGRRMRIVAHQVWRDVV